MALTIGDTAPDFEADSTEGRISFHDWIGDSWAVLFSHPRNFTPVCTTELGYMASIKPEFERRDVQVIGLSVDPVEDHSSGPPGLLLLETASYWRGEIRPDLGDRNQPRVFATAAAGAA